MPEFSQFSLLSQCLEMYFDNGLNSFWFVVDANLIKHLQSYITKILSLLQQIFIIILQPSQLGKAMWESITLALSEVWLQPSKQYLQIYFCKAKIHNNKAEKEKWTSHKQIF